MAQPDQADQGRAVVDRDPELRRRYARDVSHLAATPDAVLRARSEADVVDTLKHAASERMAVLAVGAQTSTTGASVAVGGGLVLALAGLDSAAQVDVGARLVRVAPGAILEEVRAAARAEGLQLPVDPTSRSDCTVGGAIATNASGPATFRYGPMAAWVERLRFVDGRGRVHDVGRRRVEKCAVGPPALQEPVDWLVGSEGTLGVVVEATLRLIPAARDRLTVFVPFGSEAELFAGVAALRRDRAHLPIRSIEWLDAACCRLIAGGAGSLALGDQRGGGLAIELEQPDGDPRPVDDHLEAAAELLADNGGIVEDALVLRTAADQRAFDVLRHRVPETLNQRGHRLADGAGGGKLSTDWSVPIADLGALIDDARARIGGDDVEGVWAYGHIGNGHPHLNVLCRDAAARERVHRVLADQLGRVVALGGSATSEHGVGKVKRDLVADLLPLGFLKVFAGLKAELDPDGILAPGNIAKTAT